MRSTLACQWCRSAKVKCHHNGTAPCRSCILHPGRECLLSTPMHTSKREHGRFRSRKNDTVRHPRRPREGAPQGPGTNPVFPLLAPPVSSNPAVHTTKSEEPFDHHQSPLSGLSKTLVERAFNAFVRHFPEFNIFHQPTFLKLLDEDRVPKLVTIDDGSIAKASRFFGNHVRQHIMSQTPVAMDVYLCQTLVMLCLYDWGEGGGSRAWIYNGMASRIAHGVYGRAKGLAEEAEAEAEDEGQKSVLGLHNTRLEEARRTVWACFLIDAMIGCGKCQASNHSMSVRDVSLPIREDDFAFATRSTRAKLFLNHWDPEAEGEGEGGYQRPPLLPACPIGSMGHDRYLASVIQGFHIWHTISAWVSAGGRTRDSPASQAPPWESASFCARSTAALEDWRASQSPQMRYSPSNKNLRVHVSRGEGERFAVVNLVYYLSIIFLYREYLPGAGVLSPHTTTTGNSRAPEPERIVWYEQRSQDVLAASSNIIRIMQELDQRGIQFYAATWLLRATSSSGGDGGSQGEGRSLDPQTSPSQLLSWAVSWLERACKVWRIACGWYQTLLTLRQQVYTQTGADALPMHPTHAPRRGTHLLPTLEEDMQRLAGSEPATEPGGGGDATASPDRNHANILLLLQRQQRPRRARGERYAADTWRAPESFETSASSQAAAVTGAGASAGGGESILSMPDSARHESGAGEIAPPVPSGSWPFQPLDQDLFANILADSSGDWLQLLLDTTQFTWE
ncbi:hypothetical protein BJX66DRAFT_347455 [Aspergillus keveii]|uniref:Zn(2)-C6 fungal-type domain-containing protein n=1 Tax=Aspergillus keveii TaxID=714993 RepID=A0ABR4FQB9_9EURO